MNNTTDNTSTAALLARIAELEAKVGKKDRKLEPASITATGCVNFPGVASFSGLSLNPDAFLSVYARIEAAYNLFKDNEASVRSMYAKYQAEQEAKSNKTRR